MPEPKRRPARRRERRRPGMEGLQLLDRDLSWLEFNRRVLHEALDERTPLLERANFLAIFTSNLDEFVMKRVYGLREQVRAGVERVSRDEASSHERLATARRVMQEMLRSQADAYREAIRPALAARGIHLLEWAELADEERAVARTMFETRIFPVLTPLSVDVGHPFPFISNLSLSLGLLVREPGAGSSWFARVKVPDSLRQWVRIATPRFEHEWRFVHLADLIREHLDLLFPGMDIEGVLPFRVTRNIDIDSDADDVEDLLKAVEEQLRQRRMECAVRLEVPTAPHPEIKRLLLEELDLGDEDVYEMPGLLEYDSLREVASLPIPDLHYQPWTPVVPRRLQAEDASIFDVIRGGDLLVHHPYDSFAETVLRLVREAVDDPAVQAIKMTLYRTGTDSPFIPLLMRAAESGKQVACLVELQARLDEQENIDLARRMEKAGVHVVYGIAGLKTHTKTTLIVRLEESEARCYAHIGTGNYHLQTSRIYTDLGLLTCNAVLTTDLLHLFNFLTGRSRKQDYARLLVAPANMKRRFLELIRQEADHARMGKPARIVAKMNQLEDVEVCRALSQASEAGVPVDLIVRGFCVLRPGVPALTSNVRIVSVIGRFLEHARVFYFRNAAEREADGLFFIGSADWMHRNLETRVEAITPVEGAALRQDLWEMLQIQLCDRRSAWDMQSDGTYVQRVPAGSELAAGTHQRNMERARRRN
jgi:polyphosphate kinase